MKSSAERVARHRAFKREGAVLEKIRVENVHLLAERLLEEELLEWYEAEDDEAIARATENLIRLFSLGAWSTK